MPPDPGIGLLFLSLVITKFLIPAGNFKLLDLFGSGIKKDPTISPVLSTINLTLFTLAIAPLVLPTNT